MLLSISACRLPSFGRPQTPDPPYGVWVSEEPRIMFYFKPQYRILDGWPTYIGLYTLDSVETKVFAYFGNGLWFNVFHNIGLSETGGLIGWIPEGGGGPLLAGSYRVVRDEIHYTLTPYFQEQLGIQTIIFYRVEEYDPIDPYYWFPHFFPREESEVDTP